MRKILIISISAIAMLVASQQAFARDQLLLKSKDVVSKWAFVTKYKIIFPKPPKN